MPERIPKPCRVRSCPHRTVAANGYCDQHQSLIKRQQSEQRGWSNWQQRKGNVTARGYGYDWRRLRIMTLKRDSYLCQECKRNGRLTRATCVDHIKSKSEGGDNAMTNLQSLCHRCHLTKTSADNSRRWPISEQLAAALLAQGLQP